MIYRSRWIGALAGVLTILAPAAAEPFLKPNQIITVTEDNKARKCKVIKCWADRDGTRFCQVQTLDNGEKLTIVDPKATDGDKPLQRIIRSMPATTQTGGTWRESWGKLTRWGGDTQKSAPVTVAQEVPEPLASPEQFTKVTAKSTAEPPLVVTASDIPPTATAPLAPPQAKLPGEAEIKPGLWARMNWTLPLVSSRTPTVAKPTAVENASTAGPMAPFGMRSVAAAHALIDDEPKVDEKGKVIKQPESPANAFFAGVPVVSLPGGPTVSTGGVSQGMSNAFTEGTTSRPIPADFGMGMPGGPGAFGPRPGGPIPPMPPAALAGMSPQAQAAMNMHHQMMMAQYMAMMQQQPMMPPVMHQQRMAPPATVVVAREDRHTPRLLSALNESLLPSERQMAADQLRRVEWANDPRIVPALVQAAEKDPAPMVRVSCVRALGQMGVSTIPVVEALERLKSDSDVRVREEAAESLAALKAKR